MDHLPSEDKDLARSIPGASTPNGSDGGHWRKRVWTGGHGEERQPRKRRGAPASYCIPDRVETSASANILEPLCFLSQISAVGHYIEDTVNIPFMTEVIIGVLSKNKSDLNLQLSGIRALSACASTMGNAMIGVFVGAIVSAMEEHPYDAALQIEGCRTLRRWAKMDARWVQVISNRCGGRVLPRMLNRHPKSLALLILGLDLLRVLVACCSEERSYISQNPQFIAALLQILEKYVKYSSIQQIGLSLLSWLVEDGNTKDAVVRDGGVSFILKAMYQHADDQMVQCNGAATLCWLIHTGGQRSVDDFLSNREGIKTILQTMSRYIENPSVFGNCVCILSGSSTSAADTEHLVGLEVLGMVVLGMQNHIQSPKVQRNCLTWLRLLTNQSLSSTSHDILLEAEVLGAVAAGMREHSGDAGIQIQACYVLANLCARTKVRDILSSSTCIEMVVNSQLEHRSNIRLQQAAIWFHDCMILETQVGQENAASFGGGGGVELFNVMLMGIPGQRSGAEEP
jgi:hypothetical protein